MEPVVTWDDAEAALMAAVEHLGALGDRDRDFLLQGRRSSMPAVLRIEQSDYPDRPSPRARLSKRELREVDAMLLAPDALCLAIPEQHRALVGRVIAMKLWPERAGGFRWDAVRVALQRAARTASASEAQGREWGARVPDGDALRMRYDRAIAKLSAAMTRKARKSAGECVKPVPHSPGQI